MAWSNVMGWHRYRPLLHTFSVLVLTTWGGAASPAATTPLKPSITSEQRVAAYHAPALIPSIQMQPLSLKGDLQRRVAEARHILMELQAFIDTAAQAVELGDQLRSRRRENDRLRISLSNNQTAMDKFEDSFNPSETTISALTRTIIRNWLEAVRLHYRSDDAQRRLIESKNSWFVLEGHVAALRQELVERRTELQTLKAERSALSLELDRVRRRLVSKIADTRQIEDQQRMIAAATKTLRRNILSMLRAVLLENGSR